MSVSVFLSFEKWCPRVHEEEDPCQDQESDVEFGRNTNQPITHTDIVYVTDVVTLYKLYLIVVVCRQISGYPLTILDEFVFIDVVG